MSKTSPLLAVAAALALSTVGTSALSVLDSIAHTKILPRAVDVKAEYDYIIVGGGTSGLTVADRLTESGERKFFHRKRLESFEFGLLKELLRIDTVLVIELGVFGESILLPYTASLLRNSRTPS